jgi:F-type H+-transporting ATPase subunit b
MQEDDAVLIDWFTVAAQIVNFLILVVLLRYFLYDRVVRAMEGRKQKIEGQHQEAQQNRREAEEEAESLRRQKQELEDQRKEILSHAEEEAEDRRSQMIEKARREVEEQRRHWQESLRQDQASLIKDLRQMAGRQVFMISRKMMNDLADADFEERLVAVFLKRIQAMEGEEKGEMAKAVRGSDGAVTVNSAFEPSSQSKQRLTRVIHEEIAKEAEVRYETSEDIGLGIEIRSIGRKVSWSSKDYLEDLEKEVTEVLEQESRRLEADGDEAKKQSSEDKMTEAEGAENPA